MRVMRARSSQFQAALIEEAIGLGVVLVLGASGGLPNPGDGAASQADNPGDHEDREVAWTGSLKQPENGASRTTACGNLSMSGPPEYVGDPF